MKTAIIILHYGELSVTKECVASLYKNETKPFSLIIVNNAVGKFSSKDFTTKKIIVINNPKNMGFAGGVNVGIREALKQKVDTVCLLNNDTHISKPFLQKLCNIFEEDKNVGIIGPAIRFQKNGKTLYDIGGKVNFLFGRTSHEEVDVIRDTKPKCVIYVSGCCMVIKKEVFQKIGIFDESFFLYYEDADFCLRAKKAKVLTYVAPEVVIDHALSKAEGKTSEKTIYQLVRSSIIFGEKYSENILQRTSNKFFIIFQSLLFLKANKNAAGLIIRALLQTP